MLISRLNQNRTGILAVALFVLAAAAAAVIFDVTRGESQGPDLAPADSFQQQALADGEVTDDEYAGAIANAVACMRTVGLDARAASGAAGGIETFGYATEDQLSAGRACVTAHAERVSYTWALQNSPDASERAAALADLEACYPAAGGTVDGAVLEREEVIDTLTYGDDLAATELGHCLQANMDRYGFGF